MAPLDRSHTSSYSSSVVTMAVSQDRQQWVVAVTNKRFELSVFRSLGRDAFDF